MYTQNDINLIKKNIDIIKEDATKMKLEILEPTLKEFKEDFIDDIYIRRNPYTHYKKRSTNTT